MKSTAKNSSVLSKLTLLGLILVVLNYAGSSAAAPAAEPPPNAPAAVSWDAGRGVLSVRYHGGVILDAQVVATGDREQIGGVGIKMEPKIAAGDRVEQRLRFTLAEPRDGVQLALRGTVTASGEAFPAETLSQAQQRFAYVRNSVGLSRNLRNNAVYDRRWDWALEGPGDGATRIQPRTDAGGRRTFAFESKGKSIELIFRPRFYQKHLGFAYFEPWTYRIWKGSLTGYCTWWAYRHSFTQRTLDAMLALFVAKRLPDFGYVYMQFDDTYQQGNGSCPENWLNWNPKKFPGGWQYAIKAIRAAGMKPGIWVHRVHRPSDPHVKDIAAAHPDWFVRKSDGSLVMRSGFYMLDTTNEEAVENMIRKLYRGLKAQGWEYVKIDGAGDLLRAYQSKECADFFRTHATTPEQSLRVWDTVAREELGRDVYLLACHSVANAKPLIGLVDGARLSNDGFQPRTLAQYNFLEGVVWRNDPDHCDVLGEWLMDADAQMPVFGLDAPVPARSIIRPAVCAMAGSALMVSDKLEVYQDDRNLEGMKRSAPVLFTAPGQLYSCGRRAMEWWLQEIDRPFDHWSVLARIQWGVKREKEWVFDNQGRPAQEIKFADLGLPDDREYLVFEFWDQQFLGKFTGSFVAPAMDENNGMDVFAIREARPHPWVISTTRHLSQGGVSLRDERWEARRNALAGRSAVVAGDPYGLTVYLPSGYRVVGATVDGDKAAVTVQDRIATVRLVPSATKTADWEIRFAKLQ
ncbi:MAG: alpha-galactosidase [Verrucomicrobia bacterium]|nr:alpha-galactosidase [Verrucomicrobiota bacterium]